MTPKDRPPDIGRRLSAARLQRALSQGTVARRAGLAPSYLSRIETGKVHPTFRTLFKIAKAMKMPLEEVVTTDSRRGQGGGGCPVTRRGHCLLDLIRSEAQIGSGDSPNEAYSPRQIKLIRRFTGWLERAGSDRMRAMEILLDDLSRGSAIVPGPAAAAGRPSKRGGGQRRQDGSRPTKTGARR